MQDEQGWSSFAALQQVLGGRGRKRVAPEAMFYALDALYLDAVDVREQTLDELRAAWRGSWLPLTRRKPTLCPTSRA